MVEVWLRGPIEEYPPLLMPVAHALLQAREDIGRLAAGVPEDHAWARPGGAASIGYHVLHAGCSLDRLCTYARGERLNEAQMRALRAEGQDHSRESLREVAARTIEHIDRALAQVRSTPPEALLESRPVGRAGLPSTVIGLLVHVAEHTTRHVGQALTTARIIAGRPLDDPN
jgi:DinB family protein